MSMTLATTPSLIVIDWGTSSFRAWALDHHGLVLAQKRLDIGILKVQSAMFSGTMKTVIANWRSDGSVPVIMAGMIGSRQGWVEVPYQYCPAKAEKVAAHLLKVPEEHNIFIVPGLCYQTPKRRDVMRGEETQIFGLIDEERQNLTAVLPGTHSKWAKVDGGSISAFRTFMTGELFAALKDHTILGRLMQPFDGFDKASFTSGVLQAREAQSGLLAQLFDVRTFGLFDDIAATGLSDFLSGLLIGSEIKDGAIDFAAGDIALVGHGALIDRYSVALDLFGLAHSCFGEDASLNGIVRLARLAGLLA